MRIAIVNDTLIAVEALRRFVVNISGYQLAWIAYNGVDAVKKDRKSTRLNSSHSQQSRMPSSA